MALSGSQLLAKSSTGQPKGEPRCLCIAGDARDGISMTSRLLALAAAKCGFRVVLTPESPAEIRSPANTLAGVTAATLQLSPLKMPLQDRVGLLLAMNPAGLRLHGGNLEDGGILLVNSDSFAHDELDLVGYADDPLESSRWGKSQVVLAPMTQLAGRAINGPRMGQKGSLLSVREVDRCRHFFALGMLLWNLGLNLESTLAWMEGKYHGNSSLLEAAKKTLRAGHLHGKTAGLPQGIVTEPDSVAGKWRLINGCEASALALRTVAEQSGRAVLLATTAQPPANDLAGEVSALADGALRLFLADDNAGAAAAALGASFGGALGCTAVNGTGLVHQREVLGLAAQAELPLVVIACQSAEFSHGSPQQGLAATVLGCHEAPMVVLSPDSPGDTFALTHLAARVALRFLTPVCVLQDPMTSQGIQAWQVPSRESLPGIELPHFASDSNSTPYSRDELQARPWITPGVPGGEHCLGGFERQASSARISNLSADHGEMNLLRQKRLDRIAGFLGPLEVHGPNQGGLLLLSWGGTRAVLEAAVHSARQQGLGISHAHLRALFPLPVNLGELLRSFKKVVVSELNSGHLFQILKSQFDFEGISLTRRDAGNFRASEVAHFLMRQAEKESS
ncbi:MAG: hypothetical protein EXR99_14345 [Gemmataceae bacterium]|nr:hypothetical protein [Gemmataceae bacterium]